MRDGFLPTQGIAFPTHSLRIPVAAQRVSNRPSRDVSGNGRLQDRRCRFVAVRTQNPRVEKSNQTAVEGGIEWQNARPAAPILDRSKPRESHAQSRCLPGEWPSSPWVLRFPRELRTVLIDSGAQRNAVSQRFVRYSVAVFKPSGWRNEQWPWHTACFRQTRTASGTKHPRVGSLVPREKNQPQFAVPAQLARIGGK